LLQIWANRGHEEDRQRERKRLGGEGGALAHRRRRIRPVARLGASAWRGGRGVGDGGARRRGRRCKASGTAAAASFRRTATFGGVDLLRAPPSSSSVAKCAVGKEEGGHGLLYPPSPLVPAGGFIRD
jgi:hypothetical protein